MSETIGTIITTGENTHHMTTTLTTESDGAATLRITTATGGEPA